MIKALIASVGLVGALVLLLVLLLIAPALVIWAVNTLFGTAIAYSFVNLLAALVLIFVFRGN